MNITEFGNPKEIKKICEWSKKEFVVDWKHRKQRFINIDAMYEWRKFNSRETINCLGCGKSFERYKRVSNYTKHLPTQYCSHYCSLSSSIKKEKLRNWAFSKKNHWNNIECQKKARETKLKIYGDENYNNPEKNKQTIMDKYGVPYAIYLPKCMSNGKRISKFQRKIYIDILKQFPDAELEKYLKDVKKSVDIFIPSINKVIECHGDYWHCNPSKCVSDYYNKSAHLTAKEIWEKDKEKVNVLKNAGYNVEIVWENTNKSFKHITKN